MFEIDLKNVTCFLKKYANLTVYLLSYLSDSANNYPYQQFHSKSIHFYLPISINVSILLFISDSIYLFIYPSLCLVICGVIDKVVGREHGDTTSNPERGYLRKYPWVRHQSNYSPAIRSLFLRKASCCKR